MTKEQKIVPGKTQLATWRAIYNGATACLCESARAGIEADLRNGKVSQDRARRIYGFTAPDALERTRGHIPLGDQYGESRNDLVQPADQAS